MPPMMHTAYKVNTTRNAYGDFIASTSASYKCHIREINQVITTSNDETVQSDAMAWFEPDADIQEQDIIKFEDTHYRVERITKARRLRNPAVLFLKCDLLRYGQIS